MAIRLAVGDELDLQRVTRRRIWRDFKLTKQYLITPEGQRLHPGSFRHLALMHEIHKANLATIEQLSLRLWKLETACRIRGIQYREPEHQTPAAVGW